MEAVRKDSMFFHEGVPIRKINSIKKEQAFEEKSNSRSPKPAKKRNPNKHT